MHFVTIEWARKEEKRDFKKKRRETVRQFPGVFFFSLSFRLGFVPSFSGGLQKKISCSVLKGEKHASDC